MFYQIFLSPQAKWCTIITYKHGIYELPLELPNENFVNTSKKLLKNRNQTFPVMCYFTLKLELVSDIL